MSQTAPLRAALYGQVAAEKDRATLEDELAQLRDYARERGFTVTETYSDVAGQEHYRALIVGAHARRFDVVLVYAYRRLARTEGALRHALSTFKAAGVNFISLQDEVDTTLPGGDMVMNALLSLSQFGAEHGESVRAGMARAKAAGKRVSRPPISEDVQAQIKALYEDDTSISQIAKQLGIAYGTAWNYVKRFREDEVD